MNFSRKHFLTFDISKYLLTSILPSGKGLRWNANLKGKFPITIDLLIKVIDLSTVWHCTRTLLISVSLVCTCLHVNGSSKREIGSEITQISLSGCPIRPSHMPGIGFIIYDLRMRLLGGAPTNTRQMNKMITAVLLGIGGFPCLNGLK